MSDSSGDFTGTQTPGTNIDMARGTVHDCLHTLDIGLPRAVGTPVGVRNLDPKGNTLVTELTFSHPLHLLAVQKFKWVQKAPQTMIAEFDTKCKCLFAFLQNFFPAGPLLGAQSASGRGDGDAGNFLPYPPLPSRGIYTIINAPARGPGRGGTEETSV